MIKIFKRKKNPNLKGEEFIDEVFINFLKQAMTSEYSLANTQRFITNALIYKNIKNKKCTDCKEKYDKCECEKCEDCNFNKCTCDLNTFKETWNYVADLAIKYLNQNQLEDFTDYLYTINKYNNLNESIEKLEFHIKSSK